MLSGCYASHERGGDGGAADDGSAFDAACAPIAGYERCHIETDECPDRPCGPDTAFDRCAPALGVCLESTADESGNYDERGSFEQCNVDTPMEPGQPRMFCWSGRACAGRYSDRTGLGGWCVEEAFCDAAREEGLDVDCYWSDRSERVTGAPVETTCPATNPGEQLCGGPCGECEWPDPFELYFPSFRVACVGRSDRRGLGLCAVETTRLCERGGRSGDDLCGNTRVHDPADAIFDGAPCACLAFENPAAPGTFYEWGWGTLAEACLEYQRRYPDTVRCYDADWNELSP